MRFNQLKPNCQLSISSLTAKVSMVRSLGQKYRTWASKTEIRSLCLGGWRSKTKGPAGSGSDERPCCPADGRLLAVSSPASRSVWGRGRETERARAFSSSYEASSPAGLGPHPRSLAEPQSPPKSPSPSPIQRTPPRLRPVPTQKTPSHPNCPQSPMSSCQHQHTHLKSSVSRNIT